MPEIMDYISNNGFAIFVAVYMLVYQSQSMKALTDAVNNLAAYVKAFHGDDAK